MKWTPQKASCITPFRGYNTDIPRQLLDKYDCATDSGVIRRRVIHPHINARQSTATPHTSKNHDLAKPDIRQRSPNIATLSNTQRTWEWRRPGGEPAGPDVWKATAAWMEHRGIRYDRSQGALHPAWLYSGNPSDLSPSQVRETVAVDLKGPGQLRAAFSCPNNPRPKRLGMTRTHENTIQQSVCV